jgi:hypothetical protein
MIASGQEAKTEILAEYLLLTFEFVSVIFVIAWFGGLMAAEFYPNRVELGHDDSRTSNPRQGIG